MKLESEKKINISEKQHKEVKNKEVKKEVKNN